MTDLPEELGQWNCETILELVRTRQFEPEQIDYKEVLHAERGDRRPGISRSQKPLARWRTPTEAFSSSVSLIVHCR